MENKQKVDNLQRFVVAQEGGCRWSDDTYEIGENDWKGIIADCLDTLRNDNGEEQSEQILLHEVPLEYEGSLIGGLDELAKTESNNAYWPHFMGRYYLKQGRYDEAVTWFEEAFKRNSHATELAYLAYACHKTRRYYTARNYGMKATTMEPTNDLAQWVYAHLWMDAECFKEARDVMEKYLPYNPNNPVIHQLLAEALRCEGDLEKALEHAEEAVSFTPDVAVTYFTRAKILHDLGREDEEKHDLEHTLDLLATEEDAYIDLRYLTLMMLGRTDEARMELAKGETMCAHQPEYQLYKALSLAVDGRSDEALEMLNNAFHDGLIKFKMVKDRPLFKPLREVAGAMEAINKAEIWHFARLGQESLDKESSTVWSNIPYKRDGDRLLIEGEVNDVALPMVIDWRSYENTISAAQAASLLATSDELKAGSVVNLRSVNLGGQVFDDVRATVVDDEDAPLVLGQAMWMRIMMIYDAEEENGIISISKEFNVYGLYDLYCLALVKNDYQNDPEGSADVYDIIYEMSPTVENAYRAGYQNLMVGRQDKVIEIVDKALANLDQNTDDGQEQMVYWLLRMKMTALLHAGRFEEGITIARILEKIDPSDSNPQHMQGWALRNMDRLEEAEEVLLRANASDEENVIVQDELGMVYRKMGKQQQAREAFEKAAGLPTSIYNVMHKAEALMHLGRVEECRNVLAQGCVWAESEEMDTLSRANIFVNAALIYAGIGDVDIAEHCLKRSVDITPVIFQSIRWMDERDVLRSLPCFEQMAEKYWND